MSLGNKGQVSNGLGREVHTVSCGETKRALYPPSPPLPGMYQTGSSRGSFWIQSILTALRRSPFSLLPLDPSVSTPQCCRNSACVWGSNWTRSNKTGALPLKISMAWSKPLHFSGPQRWIEKNTSFRGFVRGLNEVVSMKHLAQCPTLRRHSGNGGVCCYN